MLIKYNGSFSIGFYQYRRYNENGDRFLRKFRNDILLEEADTFTYFFHYNLLILF